MPTNISREGYEKVLDEALRNCESEPIRTPGSIQPHGVLLGIDPASFEIILASENVAEYLGCTSGGVLGSDLGSVVGGSLRERIERFVGDNDLSRPCWFVAPIDRDGAGLLAEASLHRRGPILVLELEWADPAGIEASIELSSWIKRFSHEAGEAGPLVEFFQRVVTEVSELGGYDHTMVYRFHPDDHGEVIAESVRPDLAPYLGLHFPATDIPRQARELYLHSRVRVLVDVRAKRVPLCEPGGLSTVGQLDMTFCQLRSFSPVHLEYLDNMGVQASLVTSILLGDRLWGLLVCHHHRSPLKPSYAVRAACGFLSELISAEVAAHEERDQLRARRAASDLQRQIMATVADGTDWRDAILSRPEPCKSPISASGLAIVEGATVRSVGLVPDAAKIREIAAWITRNRPGPLFATDALGACEPTFAGLATACGVLAIEIGPALPTHLIWFRHELIRDVAWGGDPTKELVLADEGARLSPRKSFDAWTSTILGRSAPWESGELIAAGEIRASLAEVVEVVFLAGLLQKADTNIELVRTRRAVDAILIADEKGRPLFANLPFIELFRATPEDLPEHSVCAPIADPAQKAEILAATLGAGGSWRGDVETPGPAGEPIPVALGVDSVHNKAGAVVGFIAIHFDLTERQRARRELERHSRRLEAARAEIEKRALFMAEAKDVTEVADRVWSDLALP